MQKHSTEPWASIVDRYRRYVEEYGLPVKPLYALARHIAISPYASGLFPYVAMHELALVQTEVVFVGQERLLITSTDHNLTFAFTDSHGGLKVPPDRLTLRGHPAWHTESLPDEGFSTLVRFLDRVGWFPKPVQSV